MKKTIAIFALLTAMPLVGCMEGEDQVTYDWVTRGPYNYDAVGGCWFDADTTVIRGDVVETMCDVRARGEEIACNSMCFRSALATYDTCGTVSQCNTLLWVEDDNGLAEDTGCWTCADGCFPRLDRSVGTFEECRAPSEEETAD